MKYLFIAEKPDVMRSVQDTYQRHRADIISKVGELDFTALSGHVCRYLEPDEYPQWKGLKWAEVDLPMIPSPFCITSVDKPEWKKKFLNGVKDAIRNTKYDGVIVATDADIEGNGIYYLVSEHLKLKKYKTLRFYEQSMTDQEILNSLYNMTDFYRNPRDIRMTEAYLLRSQADWLIGMNGTRALTVRTGDKFLLGRVKAPTLKIVHDNSVAIDNFKPHSDFLARAIYLEDFTGIHCEKDGPVLFETKEEVEDFIRKIGQAYTATITDIERKAKKTPPPQLYKLSSIQVEASSQFNYPPQRTQDLIQSLYERHKLLSYPRTNCEYVSTQKASMFPDLLAAASHLPALRDIVGMITQADIARVKGNKRVVNDAEVQKESHDALLPTEKTPDLTKLTQDEINIYEMVCRRLVAQFLADLMEEKTVLFADIENLSFKSTGSYVTDKGWTVLYNRKSTAETIPSDLNNGDILSILDFDAHEKKSTPPKRLTTGTLIAAMENIAKFINDPALKQIMKDAKGIGQPSTRAKITKDLLDAGYIEVKTKAEQLYITDKGKRYVETIQGFTISDPVQTAQWEGVFQGVRSGTISYPDASKQILEYVDNLVKEVAKLKVQKSSGNSHNSFNYSKHACPYCGKKIAIFKWGYRCEDNRSGTCQFNVSSYDGKLKEGDLDALLTKGTTRKIKNICKGKDNKLYDAKVILHKKGGKFATGFDFK